MRISLTGWDLSHECPITDEKKSRFLNALVSESASLSRHLFQARMMQLILIVLYELFWFTAGNFCTLLNEEYFINTN